MSRAALSAPGRTIRATDVEFLHATNAAPQTSGEQLPSLADAERAHIVRVLEAVKWNKKEAARVLDISRGTLYRKIVEYQFEPEARPAGRRVARRPPATPLQYYLRGTWLPRRCYEGPTTPGAALCRGRPDSGAVVLVSSRRTRSASLPLFAALLLLSSLTSAFKVSLPLASSGSTMSVSYAVDFAALLLLGADETMIVAVTSAWSQCTFRTQSRTAPYRTLFSMASLVITVKAVGVVYDWLGGRAPRSRFRSVAIREAAGRRGDDVLRLQHRLIAVAVALSTKQSFFGVWNENFLWSAPSYFVGAGAAAIAAAM